MIATLIIPVLLMILFAGYQELRYGPSSKGRPRRQVMQLIDYSDTRDTGFGG